MAIVVVALDNDDNVSVPDYFDIADEFVVYFGGTLGIGYYGVLVYGVEEMDNGIAMDVYVVDNLLEFYFEYLVRDLTIVMEYILHGVWDGACDNSCSFVDMWHREGFVEVFCWKTDSTKKYFLGDWRDTKRNRNMTEDENYKQVRTSIVGKLEKERDAQRRKQ